MKNQLDKSDDPFDQDGRSLISVFRSAATYLGKRHRLFRAAESGRLEEVRVLIAAGADVHAQNDYALRLAALYGRVWTARALLEAGANVHAVNDFALRVAAGNGHAETVKLLLDHGADVHAADDMAVRLATERGHVVTERVLREWIVREGSALSDEGRPGPHTPIIDGSRDRPTPPAPR